jgi:YafQ family addiction module toxin component
MVYILDISEKANKKFKKLNKKQLKAIYAKIKKILKNPEHFKPLRGDMHGARRTHLNSSFVLVYETDEQNSIVRIIDYNHHDKIY